jgi:acyl-CoA synthetase (AMP-forming)/AMP-acid ligase II
LLERLQTVFPAARIRNHYATTESGTLLVSEGDIFTVPAESAGGVKVEEGTLRLHRSLLGEFADSALGSEPSALSSSDYYDTGDRVEVVSSDPLRVRIAGRDRDWVNVGGEKINPVEVELELRTHPAVADAQVYGRPNSVVGHILCARVIARGTVDEVTLRDFLASRLHSAKVPRLFEFVSAIERTRTGKAARRYSNR